MAFKSTDVTGAEFGTHLASPTITEKSAGWRISAVRRSSSFRLYRLPDVCPTTLARYAEAMKALGPKAAKVQVLFVTLDPEKETTPTG